MTAPKESTQAARRVIRSSTTRGYLVAVVVTSVIGALASSGWLSVVLVAPSLGLASIVLLTGWERAPNRLLVSASAAVGVVTLGWAALSHSTPAGSSGIAITAGIWIVHQRRRRRLLVTLTCLAIVSVACLALLIDQQDAARTVVLLTVIATVWVLAIVQTDDGAPVYLGFLLAAWVSYRSRVFITPTGLRVKVFRTVTYPWPEILDVRTMSTGNYAAGWVRTSTTRDLEIYLAGKEAWVRLPLPNASWTGRESYEDGINRIHRAWRKLAAGQSPGRE